MPIFIPVKYGGGFCYHLGVVRIRAGWHVFQIGFYTDTNSVRLLSGCNQNQVKYKFRTNDEASSFKISLHRVWRLFEATACDVLCFRISDHLICDKGSKGVAHYSLWNMGFSLSGGLSDRNFNDICAFEAAEPCSLWKVLPSELLSIRKIALYDSPVWLYKSENNWKKVVAWKPFISSWATEVSAYFARCFVNLSDCTDEQTAKRIVMILRDIIKMSIAMAKGFRFTLFSENSYGDEILVLSIVNASL